MTPRDLDLPTTFNPEPTRLSESECERFHEDGFVHIPGLLLHTEIDSLRHACADVASSGYTVDEHLPDGFQSWRAVTTVSRELFALACDPRLVGPAIQLLGPALRLVGSQLIRRLPHHGPRSTRVPEKPGWHRDIFGMSSDLGSSAPPCAIKSAVWLSDALKSEDGGTRFLPRSQESGLPMIPRGEIDPPGWVSPAARAGDVTIFENRTAHAGGLNTSNRPFEVLMIQYGYRWLAAVINRRHPDAFLNDLSPFQRQIVEPEDCDSEGHYRPGSGAAAIREWAARWGLRRHREPQ